MHNSNTSLLCFVDHYNQFPVKYITKSTVVTRIIAFFKLVSANKKLLKITLVVHFSRKVKFDDFDVNKHNMPNRCNLK